MVLLFFQLDNFFLLLELANNKGLLLFSKFVDFEINRAMSRAQGCNVQEAAHSAAWAAAARCLPGS